MERFDIDRPQHVSQAPSRPTPADPPCASAPTQADIASEVLPPQGRTSAAEGSPKDTSVSSENSASHAALPSKGRAHAPALPLDSSMDAWSMACGRGGGVMAGGVEGLQAVLQDSSTALQQELRTAEAKMEVCDAAMRCQVLLYCPALSTYSCCTKSCQSWHAAQMHASHSTCCTHGSRAG